MTSVWFVLFLATGQCSKNRKLFSLSIPNLDSVHINKALLEFLLENNFYLKSILDELKLNVQ